MYFTHVNIQPIRTTIIECERRKTFRHRVTLHHKQTGLNHEFVSSSLAKACEGYQSRQIAPRFVTASSTSLTITYPEYAINFSIGNYVLAKFKLSSVDLKKYPWKTIPDGNKITSKYFKYVGN